MVAFSVILLLSVAGKLKRTPFKSIILTYLESEYQAC